MIEKMTESILNEVLTLDTEVFNRSSYPRNIKNIKTMFEFGKDFSYVINQEEKKIGYIFARRVGTLAYIGPLGVLKEYRNNGYAKKMINHVIEQLKISGCNIIGLETIPENGENIALYLKLGFKLAYPTIMFSKEIGNSKHTSNSKEVVSKLDIKETMLNKYLSKLTQEHKGYSLYNEVKYALEKENDIFFWIENNEVLGFLAYTPDEYPFIWGSIDEKVNNNIIFDELYTAIQSKHNDQKLKVRVNTCYDQYKMICGENMKIDRAYVRLLLNGYEGGFMNKNSESVILRAWIG